MRNNAGAPAALQAGSSVAAAADPVLVHCARAGATEPCGERRRDKPVPSVYAEQGVTGAQYAQVRACIKGANLTPPDKWSDSEGARDRDVNFFLQEVRSFLEITCMPRAVWALCARNFLSASPRKKWDRCVRRALVGAFQHHANNYNYWLPSTIWMV